MSLPIEVICDNKQDILFIKKLTKFLHLQNKKYIVWLNRDNKWSTNKNCKIIISSEFNCNVYSKKYCCYEIGRKCHIHYNCNVSSDFEKFIQSHGYSYGFINHFIAGLYRYD